MKYFPNGEDGQPESTKRAISYARSVIDLMMFLGFHEQGPLSQRSLRVRFTSLVKTVKSWFQASPSGPLIGPLPSCYQDLIDPRNRVLPVLKPGSDSKSLLTILGQMA